MQIGSVEMFRAGGETLRQIGGAGGSQRYRADTFQTLLHFLEQGFDLRLQSAQFMVITNPIHSSIGLIRLEMTTHYRAEKVTLTWTIFRNL